MTIEIEAGASQIQCSTKNLWRKFVSEGLNMPNIPCDQRAEVTETCDPGELFRCDSNSMLA
jgi:hypothetical protein